MPLPRKEKPLERGERVYLRRPVAEDTKEVIAAVRTSRRLHRPWVYPTETKAAFDGYIRRNQEPDFVGLLICRLSDDRILGMANLSQIFRDNLQGAYLGFWASADFAGQGYMAEGIRLVLRHAFKKLKLHRLEANVQPGNERSKALPLLEKIAEVTPAPLVLHGGSGIHPDDVRKATAMNVVKINTSNAAGSGTKDSRPAI